MSTDPVWGTRPAVTDRTTVVMITHDRRDAVLATLPRLLSLPERVPVVLVDNASTDGVVEAVRARHSQVDVVRLEENIGAAARTEGVRRARTPYVAFSDDDSWWSAQSLTLAADVLDRVPRLGVLAGQVRVGTRNDLDPVCVAMANSPLGDVPGAGPRILGFVACGAVVRRSAYLDAGGFHARYGVGGEESLLALDLAERGWHCAYVADVLARHHPSPVRDHQARRVHMTRNDLYTLWLRRPLRTVLPKTARVFSRAGRDTVTRAGLRHALGGLPWVLAERRPVSRATEQALRALG